MRYAWASRGRPIPSKGLSVQGIGGTAVLLDLLRDVGNPVWLDLRRRTQLVWVLNNTSHPVVFRAAKAEIPKGRGDFIPYLLGEGVAMSFASESLPSARGRIRLTHLYESQIWPPPSGRSAWNTFVTRVALRATSGGLTSTTWFSIRPRMARQIAR